MTDAPMPETNRMLAALAARSGDGFPPAAALSLVVADVRQLTPSMRRVTLTGEELGDFTYLPGQDLMLEVPTGDGGRINRRYTVRAFDGAACTVDLDLIAHDHGPGGRWARAALPGDRIDAIGPRGKVILADDAAWHLFVCDESGLPAVASMTEALPVSATALVFADVAGPEEQQPLGPAASVVWLHRDGAAPGGAGAIVDAVAAASLPDPEAGHAYLMAEMGVVSAVRAVLIGRGFVPDRVAPKAYWRRGAANARHGEPLHDRA
ncbi:MAG TPA: siderophore-interacting protein [Acidimicrobiia bacterium]